MTTAGTSTAIALCTGPNHCHERGAPLSHSSLSACFRLSERPPTRLPLQMQGAIRLSGSGVVRRTPRRGKTGCEPGRTVAGLRNPVTMNANASIARRLQRLDRGHGVCFSPRQTPHARRADAETPRKRRCKFAWEASVRPFSARPRLCSEPSGGIALPHRFRVCLPSVHPGVVRGARAAAGL